MGPIPGALGENFTSGGTNKFYRVNHDYIIRANLLNHFTFGYNQRDIFEAGPLRISADVSKAIQLRGTTNPTTLQPTQYSTEYGTFNRSIDTASPSRTFNLNEQLAWVNGKHNVKFGFQYLLAKYARFDCNGCSGEVGFSNAGTGNPGISARNGSSYASFLLGLASGGNFNYSANIEFFFPYYAWFVQDDWKLTSKLTLNLGLRYEISYSKQESNFQNTNFNPSIPNPGAGNLLGALEFAGEGPGRSGKKRFQDTRYNGFGPRVGLAYQLTPNTVLRAGSAVYYQAMREDGNADNGVQGFGGRFNALGDFLSTGISFRVNNGLNEFGDLVARQKPPRTDPTLLNFGTPTYMTGEAGRAPMFYDWNATVEHSFFSQSVARISYHANVGVRLLNNRQNFNQLDPRYWAIYGDLLGRRLDDPQVIATGFVPPYA
ncbi:MAG: TonB-dependent receptor, partial [Bryobacteraceae bacterium]